MRIILRDLTELAALSMFFGMVLIWAQALGGS
jgi:hypothetical protein